MPGPNPPLRPRFLLLLLATATAAPAFNISNVFSSHAVLQRDKPLTLWGWSTAPVSARWVDGVIYASGAPDSAGVWRITFPSSPASTVPFSLTLTSAGSDNVTLDDLQLGDVIFCAGQSNMGAVQVSAMWNVTEILTQAVAFQAGLRLFQVSGNVQSQTPATEWPTSDLMSWQAPLGVDGNATGPLLAFSAVCYIMGATLFDEHLLRRVPIGLIHSSHGGTSIQAWASPAGATQCGDNSDSWNSSVLYNSNVHPLVVGPATIAAIYWYQGEEDCGIGSTETFWRAAWYGCSLRALIRDWREMLQDSSIFWLEQQLHAWLHTDDIGLATFRAAQLKALDEPLSALSTAFDGGDPASAMAGSPGGTVHSHDKYIPGRRAAAALAGAHYNLSVPYLNPRYGDAVARSVSNATHTAIDVTVSLLPATVSGGGLVLRGYEPLSNSSHCPTERGVNASYCDWMSVQVNDSGMSWWNATISLTPDTRGLVLRVIVPGRGLAAVATRNGFSDWPVVTVYDANGLPLAPWWRGVNAV